MKVSQRARCFCLTGLSSFYKQAPSGRPWTALGSWACWEIRWQLKELLEWRTSEKLSKRKGLFPLFWLIRIKLGRYSMKNKDFRKVVQVAQLVRAKDWKSLCQWFESTSKQAKGPNRSRERAGFGNSSKSKRKPKNVSAPALYGFLAPPYLAGGRFSKKSGSPSRGALWQKGWASSVRVFIDRVDLYASEGETRCSAVWSAHLFWVQRAIGSNPVTLM